MEAKDLISVTNEAATAAFCYAAEANQREEDWAKKFAYNLTECGKALREAALGLEELNHRLEVLNGTDCCRA